MIGGIHLNDEGTILERTVEDPLGTIVSLASATLKEVKFLLPDLTVLTKTLVFKTDGTDGIVRYIFESGILNQLGRWRFQLHFTLPNGDWRTDIESFRVWENL